MFVFYKIVYKYEQTREKETILLFRILSIDNVCYNVYVYEEVLGKKQPSYHTFATVIAKSEATWQSMRLFSSDKDRLLGSKVL
jgi:hypothetical protein